MISASNRQEMSLNHQDSHRLLLNKFVRKSLYNHQKFILVTPTIKLELSTDVQMQLLNDDFAGREPDFCKKLITECKKKQRKDVLAKAKEEKQNAKKVPDVLKEDKEKEKETDPKDPKKTELSHECLF